MNQVKQFEQYSQPSEVLEAWRSLQLSSKNPVIQQHILSSTVIWG